MMGVASLDASSSPAAGGHSSNRCMFYAGVGLFVIVSACSFLFACASLHKNLVCLCVYARACLRVIACLHVCRSERKDNVRTQTGKYAP
jgi:hypothetical protein